MTLLKNAGFFLGRGEEAASELLDLAGWVYGEDTVHGSVRNACRRDAM